MVFIVNPGVPRRLLDWLDVHCNQQTGVWEGKLQDIAKDLQVEYGAVYAAKNSLEAGGLIEFQSRGPSGSRIRLI